MVRADVLEYVIDIVEETSSAPDIPHRIRCDSQKDEREPFTLFLSNDDARRVDDFKLLANREFDEKVYRLDVLVAAMRAGIDNDDEVFLEAMGDIGYSFSD